MSALARISMAPIDSFQLDWSKQRVHYWNETRLMCFSCFIRRDVSKYPDLIEALLRKGLTNKQVKLIAGDNTMRVVEAVEHIAATMVDKQPDRTQYDGQYEAPPNENAARHGAVAADSAQCSVVGVELLRAGGHAVDAAVGTALCLGVVRTLLSC
jgi:hypothetical protein